MKNLFRCTVSYEMNDNGEESYTTYLTKTNETSKMTIRLSEEDIDEVIKRLERAKNIIRLNREEA